MDACAKTSQIVGCSSRTAAQQLLKELGVEWDRVIVDRMSKRVFDYRFGWQTVFEDGLFEYFMLRDGDVAYWTPALESLHIHPQRRSWAPEFLLHTRELYRFGDHV